MKKRLSFWYCYCTKVRYCTEWKKDSICSGCDEKINQIKEVAPNLSGIKRQPVNSFGHVLPLCVDSLDENLQRF